jgi:hypothetical protein
VIPNVRRGQDMVRLIKYLVGPGKRNEHTDPHLVAGSSWQMAWHSDAELSYADATAMGKDLEAPTRAFDVEVPRGHVWHCSLSLDAAEGRLADDEWAEIAEQFMTRMGFVTDDLEQPSLRWVAIRHGVSSNGNDHIHLAVNLVHEDGSVADVFRDWKRAQSACRELESQHGLRQVGMNGRSCIGYKPGEIEAEARRRARAAHARAHEAGREQRTWGEIPKAERHAIIAHYTPTETVRWMLARQVRAASTGSADEGEFVRRVRRQGLLIRPRFARGTQDVVVGYRVAARPRYGERPIWFGGGHLAHDLTLPRLREAWPDTPQASLAASAEWRAAWRGIRVAAPGRETREPAPDLPQKLTTDLDAMRAQLHAIPPNDLARWGRAAGQVSGALSAWSVTTEPTPGPLAQAADAIARSAELRRPPLPRPDRVSGMSSIAGLILAGVGKGRKTQEMLTRTFLLRQLLALGSAVADAHQAVGELRRAEQINRVLNARLAPMLQQLEASMPPAHGTDPAPAASDQQRVVAAAFAQPAGSVIPPSLPTPQPARPRERTTRAGSGIER